MREGNSKDHGHQFALKELEHQSKMSNSQLGVLEKNTPDRGKEILKK